MSNSTSGFKTKEESWNQYYLSQLGNVYEDTKDFVKLLKSRGYDNRYQTFFDLGCGGGSRTLQIASQFPKLQFAGGDYVASMINLANDLQKKTELQNVHFEVTDWFNIPQALRGKFDLVFSFHTFCCFKDPEASIRELMKLAPKAIVMKSLFYDGPMDVLIHQRNLNSNMADDDHDGDFNIFSMQRIRDILSTYGWKKVEFIPFEISIDLPQPSHGSYGSYTRRLDDHARALFSGPIFLPWYFLVAEKE